MLLNMFPLWVSQEKRTNAFWCDVFFKVHSYQKILKHKTAIDFFLFFFFFKGKCYFSRCHSPLLLSFNLAKTLPFKLLQRRGNQTNKQETKPKKTSTEGFIRPEQNTVSVVQGNNHPPLSCSAPKRPKS